jgi:L-alanine-DL-glutamate epimerase-like enolase superfamily enzyme
MKIVHCACRHARVPREEWWPLPLAGLLHQVSQIELITCELETDSGLRGFGYTYTLGHGGVGVQSILAHEIAPVLMGRDTDELGGLWDELWWRLHWVGRGGVVPVAMAAADIAIWDLRAKAAELPLHRYLGSTGKDVPAYGSGVDLAYDDDELVESVRAFREQGLLAYKIKVGRAAGEDLARIAAVRAEIGDAPLMVDANQGWDLAEAARRARSFEQYDIAWLEEPLVPEDVDGHAELQAGTSVPIAAGETLFSPYEFKNYFRHSAMRVVQADVTRLGGITGWLEVARMAEAFHLPMAPHFMQDIHVQLLGAIPNPMYLEYLPWFDHFVSRPLVIRAGRVAPGDEPGHGVSFRDGVLDDHIVDETTSS